MDLEEDRRLVAQPGKPFQVPSAHSPKQEALRQTPRGGHPYHSHLTDGTHEASGRLGKPPGRAWPAGDSCMGREEKAALQRGQEGQVLLLAVTPSGAGRRFGLPSLRGCVLGAPGEAVSQEGTPPVCVEPEERGEAPHPGLPLPITNHPGSAIVASGTVK